MQAALHAFGPRVKRALLPLDPSSQRVIGAVADVARDKWRSVVLGNHAPPMELPPTCVGYWPSPSSAKLACLAARGELAPGARWVQESVIGTRFTARYDVGENGTIRPRITGRAWVTAEATLVRDPSDPFPNGIGGSKDQSLRAA